MSYDKEKALELAQSTFLSCSVISKNQLAVLMVIDKGEDVWETTPPVRLFIIPCDDPKKEWVRIIWHKDRWVFPTVEKASHDDLLIVDGQGGVYYSDESTGKGDGEDPIQNELNMNCTYCNLSGLKNIHGEVYIVGSFRRVFRRKGENKWSIVSSDEMIADAESRYDAAREKRRFFDTGFKCIDGFDALNEIYAAGENSDVWRFSDNQWLPIDIGFLDENIISICCADDGFVYMGTRSVDNPGKVIKGRNNEWIELDLPFNSDIISIASFKGKTYIATSSQLYIYDGGKVEAVKYNLPTNEVPLNAGFLSVGYGWMLSVGNSSISIFDGKEWKILYGASLMDEEASYALASESIKKSANLLESLEDAVSKKNND